MKNLGDNFPRVHQQMDFQSFEAYDEWKKRQALQTAFICQLILVCLLAIGVFFFMPRPANSAEIDLSIIATIESNNNPRAVGSGGDVGLYQITPILIREWNNFHPRATYQISDMFDPAKAEIVARWYLGRRIPQMIKHYGKPDTIENRIIAWNAGISYVKTGKPLPKITQNFIRKYKRLAGLEG